MEESASSQFAQGYLLLTLLLLLALCAFLFWFFAIAGTLGKEAKFGSPNRLGSA